MKAEDIRPEDLESKQLELLREDGQELLKRHTEFVEVTCPACDSFEKSSFAFHKYEYKFERCNKCDTLFVNPRPTQGMLEEYYAWGSKNMNFWNDVLFPATEVYRKEKIAKPSVERVLEFCRTYDVAPNAVLELGAGYGIFAEEMIKAACSEGIDPFKLIAVEASKKFADTCELKGIDVINSSIEKYTTLLQSTTFYDVVLGLEVISHLFRPKKMIEVACSCLRKNGLLILATPNIHGFDLLMLRKYSDNIGAPNHLNYFNDKSIQILLEDCGFETLDVVTPGELDAELVRNKALNREIDLSDNPFLTHVLIDKWKEHGKAFQDYLVAEKMSSHMWVVARKK